jgi:hypothetical protein
MRNIEFLQAIHAALMLGGVLVEALADVPIPPSSFAQPKTSQKQQPRNNLETIHTKLQNFASTSCAGILCK